MKLNKIIALIITTTLKAMESMKNVNRVTIGNLNIRLVSSKFDPLKLFVLIVTDSKLDSIFQWNYHNIYHIVP